MSPPRFRKSPPGFRPNSLSRAEPLPAIPTPDPDKPFPALDPLPEIEYTMKKNPEESGVRLKTPAQEKPKKAEKTWEEERIENKLSELEDLRVNLDKFVESWKKLGGDDWEKSSDEMRWELLDADEQWDLREKLIKASSLVAENESDAVEKQGGRTADLLRFIPAARPVSLRVLDMFKDKLGMFIEKAQKKIKDIRQDGVDYIAA
jgi:hypothetical protein